MYTTNRRTEGDDEIYHNLGVFVLGRILRAHGIPSLMRGGSVFDLVIIFQRASNREKCGRRIKARTPVQGFAAFSPKGHRRTAELCTVHCVHVCMKNLAAFGGKPKNSGGSFEDKNSFFDRCFIFKNSLSLSTPHDFGALEQTNLFGAFAGLGAGRSMASEARVSPESAMKGGESPSSISQFFRQVGALIRKNFLSKRRSKLQLVSERCQGVCWVAVNLCV